MSSVYVVWFLEQPSTPSREYNWSLFVAPTDSVLGNKYGINLVEQTLGPTGPLPAYWRRDYFTDCGLFTFPDLGGALVLGETREIPMLRQAILETRPPTSLTESSQRWVKKVVELAIEKKALPSTAIEILDRVPVA